MIDISVHDLNKYYGSNHVIQGVTFEVYSGEKVGLLGKNGSGKTTLFKVITGEEYFESGSIAKATGRRIEILKQIPVFGDHDTVEDVLRTSFQEVTDIYQEMKKIEGDDTPSVLARYGRLMEDYERLGGYETEVRLDTVCSGMNIDERMRRSKFSLLSGGERTRVNLARILLKDCDILLLDEPTNHLDLASLEWLEGFLSKFSGTVIAISHDRVFLDNVVTRIIEIENGKVNFYKGNYSYYVEEKERRLQSQAEQYEQQQKKIQQLDAAAKRLHQWARQADNEALHKRAFAIEKRIERMDKVERPKTERALTGEFESGGHAAKEVLYFDSASKSYGAKTILRNLDLSLYRNERIALVGANGCGKSTVLKMIMGEETCDSGLIKVSVNIKPAYMPQIVAFDDESATVLGTLRGKTDLTEEKARSVLARFHFRGEDVMKRVGSLSGGEKSRLKLCLLMQQETNFLLLDEPTNHLDIASREWIEKVLSEFPGTMLFVSHDRYFLNKFATAIWSMEDGAVTKYDCGFEEYLRISRAATGNANARSEVRKEKGGSPSSNEKRKSRPNSSKKTVSAEVLIGEAEAELEGLNAEIEANIARSDFQNMAALVEKKARLEEKIEALYEEWLEAEQ